MCFWRENLHYIHTQCPPEKRLLHYRNHPTWNFTPEVLMVLPPHLQETVVHNWISSRRISGEPCGWQWYDSVAAVLVQRSIQHTLSDPLSRDEIVSSSPSMDPIKVNLESYAQVIVSGGGSGAGEERKREEKKINKEVEKLTSTNFRLWYTLWKKTWK